MFYMKFHVVIMMNETIDWKQNICLKFWCLVFGPVTFHTIGCRSAPCDKHQLYSYRNCVVLYRTAIVLSPFWQLFWSVFNSCENWYCVITCTTSLKEAQNHIKQIWIHLKNIHISLRNKNQMKLLVNVMSHMSSKIDNQKICWNGLYLKILDCYKKSFVKKHIINTSHLRQVYMLVS